MLIEGSTSMAINGLSLKESMSKNIQAIMPLEEEKAIFKENLLTLLTNLQEKQTESEEFQKNLIKDFLQSCLPKQFINTSKRADMAIYNGNSPNSSVGVLIEVKSLSNKHEMMSKEKINSKAFQETIHYYFQERMIHQNIEIKKCIVTNGLNWFVIESKEMDKHFYKDKKLVDFYQKWVNGQLVNSTTDFLYTEVISPFIDKAIENGLSLAHFDLQDALKKGTTLDIKNAKLTQLFRFFSAENLLNKEIFSDSNKLNKGFYDELLYLMGLEEVKVGNQKVIQRFPIEKRQKGTFVENIIDKLQMNDVSEKEQYDIAIQLSVVWINRILFLKLLESQLVLFNGNDNTYQFLTKEKLPTFDDFYQLFFGVLAKKINQRNEEMRKKYPHVPYLNSSLFEETELEKSNKGLSIDRLRELEVDFYSHTVLKDTNNKRKTGKINFLTYFFEFLNAYDISTSVHQEKNKHSLINASVLGLIFEKINGYRDGSYFTPGYITMYMSKNAVRKSIIQKVNEVKGWECQTIYDIDYHISNREIAKEVSEIIDTITICDPAVGSGHFLVSILNELIAVKSELRVLFDEDGRIMNDIRCTVVNDELVIQDMNGDNFVYHRGNPYTERIQKSIFLEKRKLIEGCLFGVDLNPNSVNICRLRLWIELLKHSYYYEEEETGISQLITLPNIDINIKVGNSLFHKFQLDEGLDKRFTDIKQYFQLVHDYKSTNDKQIKRGLTESLTEIKSKFKNHLLTPEFLKVAKLTRELNKLNAKTNLFLSSEEQRELKKKQDALIEKLNAAQNEFEKSGDYPLFARGLEWRMEFPEILDKEGNFVGFDIIIANPPYIYSTSGSFSDLEKDYFLKEYPLCQYQANTFGLFLELSLYLLRENGYCSMIIPNTFLTIGQYHTLRNHLLTSTGDVFILNSHDKLFEDANVDNCIVNFKRTNPSIVELVELKNHEIHVVNTVKPEELLAMDVINFSAFSSETTNEVFQVLKDMDTHSKKIHENYGVVKDGLKVYERKKGTPPQPEDKDDFEEFKKKRTFFTKEKVNPTYRKFLDGSDIGRYELKWSGQYLSYGNHLAAKRNHQIFEGKRILIRRIPQKSVYALMATYTDGEYVHEQSIETIYQLTAPPLFLLGVLNSKVESFWALHKYDFLQRKTFPQMRLYQIQEFPIPNATVEEQEHLAHMVETYRNILEKDESDMEQIESMNNEIDEYVMTLYRLSEEGKRIVREFQL